MRWWSAALAIGCVSSSAAAQAPDAQAAALFEQAITEMKNGNFAKACPALAESVRLDRRPGAVFTLADCETEWGRLASALAHYRDYLDLVTSLSNRDRSAQAERMKAARSAIDELERTVPKLTLHVSSRSPSDTIVELDGTVLGAASLGVALPLDPGEHTLVVRAKGRTDRTLPISLARSERRTVEIDAGAPIESSAPAPVAQPRPKPEPIAPTRPSSSVSPWTYVAFGVGLAGIGVGTATGLMAFSEKSKVDDNCDGIDCNQSGLDAADRGKRYALVSTIAFAVGAAGVGTGLALWFSTGSDPKVGLAWSRSW